MSEGWNILVVDDEPPIRAELRYLLEKDTRVGQIAEAGNVTEAVESILSNKPDVLFLDITMPGRSGIELAETLQNLKTPPVVVFVTAFAEYAADAYNLDAVDYIVKPVEDARLSSAARAPGHRPTAPARARRAVPRTRPTPSRGSPRGGLRHRAPSRVWTRVGCHAHPPPAAPDRARAPRPRAAPAQGRGRRVGHRSPRQSAPCRTPRPIAAVSSPDIAARRSWVSRPYLPASDGSASIAATTAGRARPHSLVESAAASSRNTCSS